MGGKAKFTKHTAKDLAERQNQKNKGGGGAGIQTRLVAKLNYTCDICMVRSQSHSRVSYVYEFVMLVARALVWGIHYESLFLMTDNGFVYVMWDSFLPQSASPDIKSYEAHYLNKHPKATFDKDAMVKKAEAARAAMLEKESKVVAGSHHKKK